MLLVPSESARTLFLSPSTALASPRGWQTLGTPLPANARYDEVHCYGGGSLLLWLLACAHRAPRSRVVYFHGPVVLPTPESCTEWLARAGSDTNDADQYEWRRQAVSLGVGGGLDKGSEWLKPLLTSIATGRSYELGARATDMQRRWERNGRIVYKPLPEEENDVLTELLHGARFSIDSSDCERPPALLKCGEAGCQLEIC